MKSLPSLLKVNLLLSGDWNSISTVPSVVVRILKFYVVSSQKDENSISTVPSSLLLTYNLSLMFRSIATAPFLLSGLTVIESDSERANLLGGATVPLYC